MKIETRIAQQLITDILATANRPVMIHFHTPTGECWFELQPGAGADLITDYHGPDEVVVPMLEAAQNIVDPHC